MSKQFREFTPEEWIEEIQFGLEYRRKYGLEDKWGELEAMYYNVHPSMANDGPNILAATGDSMLSNLTVPTPRVLVQPRHQEAVAKAPLVEALDNTLLEEMSLQEETDTACLYAYLFGRGFIKCGYDSEFGYDPIHDIGGSLKLGMTFSQYDRMGRRRLETDDSILPGMPWTKAVDPRDIVVPYGTQRLSSAPWIAHRIIRHYEDLKADRKYKLNGLQPKISMESYIEGYKRAQQLIRAQSLRKPDYVEMWEIHDRRNGRIKVVVADHPHFLRDDINALQIENRLPFASIAFVPRCRSFWVTPDAYYIQHAQIELSDLAVQRSKQRRISTLKFLYVEDAIDETEVEKITSPEVGAAAKVKNTDDINKVITSFQNAQLNQSLMLEEEHVRHNAREQIGFSRNQLGEFVGGRRTAREAGIVQAASELRMSRRGLALKRLYEDCFTLVNGIVFTHWVLPRYIQVLGPDQASQWAQINGPTLKSRYAYSINFSNEEELRMRRIEALQMYQMLSQDPSVDPVQLRDFLTTQYNDPQISRLFNADIQNAMRALRFQAGLIQSQGGQQPDWTGNSNPGAMPMLPNGGQAGQTPTAIGA